MGEKKERKSNLVTVRISEEDKSVLNSLSDYTDKSTSDTILRACRFFLNVGDVEHDEGSEEDKKVKKRCIVHLRMTDTDKELVSNRSLETGDSLSEIVRKALKTYDRYTRRRY